MKRAAKSSSGKGLLLNKTKSAKIPAKISKKDDVDFELVEDASEKTNHYMLTEIKGSEDENEIAFVLTEKSTEDGNKPLAECREEIQIEEACEDLEDNDDDKVNTEEIVEHVCGKCYKSFRTIKVLKRHIKYCLFNSEMEVRKEKMLENIKKIEKEAIIMEKKDLCFCCGESYDTCHLGHINCPECPKSFKSQLILERHIFLIHSEVKEFPCTICNGNIRTLQLQKLHIEQHKNRGKPYACKRCGKDFTRQYHLRRHLLYTNCGDGQAETIKCKVCDKEFYRLDNLRVHLKSHLGQGTIKRAEYTCPYCKKCFYSLSTLNIHVRTHTGERPYDCDLCEKNFPSLMSLKKHRRYHTGEKPYTCSVCQQTFAVKEVLNRHMKRHTGEKAHACEICEKRFIQATQLRNHQRTHLRPYECMSCDEKFKTEKQLEKHLKVHNKSTIARRRPRNPSKRKLKSEKSCPHCGEVFPDSASAKYHQLKEHVDANEPRIDSKDEELLSIVEEDEKVDTEIETKNNESVVIGEFIIESLPEDTAVALEESSDNIKVIAHANESDGGEEKAKLQIKNVSADLKAELRKSLARQLKEDPLQATVEKKMSDDDREITENVNKLLDILVDLETLVNFGWLNDTVENVLCKVIENCGYNLYKTKFTEDYGTRMREYVKLLFTVVIQNDSIKELLNNYSIDEVIDFVLTNDEN